jgi:hypothetical protein
MHKARLLILVTCLALVVVPASGIVASAMAQQNQAGNVAFPTPEDAIAYFFEGVAQGDLAKILQSSAIDEMSENFKFDLYVERLRAFAPFQSFAPANYPLYVEINRAEMTSRISNEVKLLAYSLLAGDDIDFDRTILMDIDGARNIVSSVDPSRLAQLELIDVSLPSPTMMNSARYHEIALRIAGTFGADDSTERVALFSFEQNDYILGFSLLRYGDTWKISSATSPISGTSSLGIAEKITQEEFAAMTS